jgi:hypothetical protein
MTPKMPNPFIFLILYILSIGAILMLLMKMFPRGL